MLQEDLGHKMALKQKPPNTVYEFKHMVWGRPLIFKVNEPQDVSAPEPKKYPETPE